MPQTFLVFDFGTNEEAAQQARHRLEGWRQAFRLGDKLKFKFERQPAEAPAEAADSGTEAPKKKSKKKKAEEPAAAQPTDRLRVLVRLEFSEHEKLSYQRWLDRIPSEPPFQSAEKRIVRRNQEAFEEVSKAFDELV
jgi:hypothetical protein